MYRTTFLSSFAAFIAGATCLVAASCPVNVPYSPIYDTYYNTPGEAIQHQFAWQTLIGLSPSTFELPVIQNFKIPLKPVYSYSKADSKTPIYGYHKNGKLDLKGGTKKTYNKFFTDFKTSYRGALESKYPGDTPSDTVTQTLTFLTPKEIKNIYNHNVPYFHERGFDIQRYDTFEKFDNQFIYTLSLATDEDFAIRFIWDDESSSSSSSDECGVPNFVDLHGSTSNLYVIDTYQKNPSKYKNGYGYPTRIPVTSDFCTYEQSVGVSPIAFYDKNEKAITIHVPTTDAPLYFLVKYVPVTGNPALDSDYTAYLAGFDGSFKLFKRTKDGRLVASSIDKATVLAQNSETVYVRNLFQIPGEDDAFEEVEILQNEAIFADDVQSYTGVVLNPLDGGNNEYDNYILPIPILNAYENIEDPLTVPRQRRHHHNFHTGDNPVTRIKESFSGVSTITLFDYDLWDFFALKLPLDVIKGKTTYPEIVSITPAGSAVPGAEAYITVHGHEFAHQMQISSGAINFVPAEASAVGIELDPHLSNGVYFPFRGPLITLRLLDTFRGNCTPMTLRASPFNTYGMGSWWKYLQDQFDSNNQIIRRTVDVLANETAGPLLKKNDFPDEFYRVVNTNGSTSALKQATKELFNKNIKKVWSDYCVSATMLRNNTSIPKKWRNYFPYWIFNSEYPGYDAIVAANSLFGLEQYSNFWEVMDENGVVPPDYNTAYTGQTFIPTLPEHFEADAKTFAAYAFDVPLLANGGPERILVTVPKGKWRVTLVQFTSDGTKEGLFIADGTHKVYADGNNTLLLEIADHSPSFSSTGNLRLICVNTTLDGDGTELADYYSPQTPNASIIIDAPVS